jgi:hypothetical protein
MLSQKTQKRNKNIIIVLRLITQLRNISYNNVHLHLTCLNKEKAGPIKRATTLQKLHIILSTFNEAPPCR